MAEQRISGGFPFPVLINETGTEQRIAQGALINETISGGGTSVALTGVSGTGAVGTLGVKFGVPLTGVAGTGSAGTLKPAFSIALTGVSGTGAVGTLTPTSGTVVALTGVSGTGGTGSLGVKFSIPLTGVSGTGSVGTLTPASGTFVALTGVQGSGAIGNLGVQFSIALRGVSGTGQLGNMGPPVPTSTSTSRGMWPETNYDQPRRVHRPDSIREDIERALEAAEEARSPKTKREAVKELKAVTAEAAKAAAEIPDLEFMAMRLERTLQLKQSAAALITDIRRVIEAQRIQEQDDMEAFMIIAKLS